MLQVPIHCYGREEAYDQEQFYVYVKRTSGNSIKFEHINSHVSFYIQRDIPYDILQILRQLALTNTPYYVNYNHYERQITVLDIEINDKLDRTSPVDSLFNNYIKSSTTTCEDIQTQKEQEKNKGEKMNLTLKDKIYYGTAPYYFGVSFDGRITVEGKAYNPEEKVLVDTLGLSIKIPLFVLPQTNIEAGDVIMSTQDKTAFYYDGTSFIDYKTGQVSNFVPTKIFNMTFYSVVKNPLANSFNGQNSMNNLLPLLLLKDSDTDNNDLFLMMAMCNGGMNNLFGGSQKSTNKTE